MYRIIVLGFDNCLGSSIATFLDVFKIANEIWIKSQHSGHLFSWRLISEKGGVIYTSSGVELQTNEKLDKQKAEIIFIPAYAYRSFKQVLDNAQDVNSWAGNWIQEKYKQGTYIATACTGTFILGEIGLTKNREVTTSWWLKSLYELRFPEARLTDQTTITNSERILCSGPLVSHYNLAIQLIEEIAGQHIAMLCLKYIAVDSNRPTQLAMESIKLKCDHWDEQVLKAQYWIQSNIHRSFEINELAQYVNMSTRTLSRRFNTALNQSPIAYIKDLRVDIAKRLIETTDLLLDQILDRIGYTDSSSFRRLFKQKTGLSISEYKNKFIESTRNQLKLKSSVREPVFLN